MIEEEIQHILKYKTPWWNELRAVQKAEKGKNLPFRLMWIFQLHNDNFYLQSRQPIRLQTIRKISTKGSIAHHETQGTRLYFVHRVFFNNLQILPFVEPEPTFSTLHLQHCQG